VVKLTDADPFMYCERCSNVLKRRSDHVALYKLWFSRPESERGDDLVMRFYEELEGVAPKCPCGGNFRIWANVKCPSCHYEIPYDRGHRNPATRANDYAVIMLDGATMIGDDEKSTWTYFSGCSLR
jgi:hypothetical protein